MSGLGHETFAPTSAATNPPPTAFQCAADSTLVEGNCQTQNISQTERWGSVIGGAAMLVAGLRRGGISGLVVVLGGGGLLYRGYTGHCQCYEALGIDNAQRPPATTVRERFKSVMESGGTLTRDNRTI